MYQSLGAPSPQIMFSWDILIEYPRVSIVPPKKVYSPKSSQLVQHFNSTTVTIRVQKAKTEILPTLTKTSTS